MNTGFLITLEGIEGSGKSTLIQGLKDALQEVGEKIVYTREPGGTDLAEDIRKLLIKKTDMPMCALTELLLVYAARLEHITQVIVPQMAEGKVVISDRFVDASYAYQVGGRGISEDKLNILDHWIVKNCMPKLTILLKAPVDLCLQRVDARGNKDRFDSEKQVFFERVDQMYAQRMQQDPERFLLIDNTVPPEESIAKVSQVIKALLHEHAQAQTNSEQIIRSFLTTDE